MNEAFIWLSGLRFIDKNFVLMARDFFRIFTENNPARGTRKHIIFLTVNWLSTGNIVLVYLLSSQNPNLDSGSLFAEGTTRLMYIASDAAMNSRRCDVYITVQGKLISTGEEVDPIIWTMSVPSYVAERSRPDSSSGVSSRMWVRIPVVTLVSLSKTLNHNCFILRMGRKAVGPVCCVMHVKEPRTLIVKEKGLAPVFLEW